MNFHGESSWPPGETVTLPERSLGFVSWGALNSGSSRDFLKQAKGTVTLLIAFDALDVPSSELHSGAGIHTVELTPPKVGDLPCARINFQFHVLIRERGMPRLTMVLKSGSTEKKLKGSSLAGCREGIPAGLQPKVVQRQ